MRTLMNSFKIKTAIIDHDLHGGFGLKLPAVQQVELPIRALFAYLVPLFHLQDVGPTEGN